MANEPTLKEQIGKSFHANLCRIFGYAHDPVDWHRDALSLEEHIQVKLREERARTAALATELSNVLGAVRWAAQVSLDPTAGPRKNEHAQERLAVAINEAKLTMLNPSRTSIDPLSWPLPCDVVVGNGTHRAGTSLGGLVARMKSMEGRLAAPAVDVRGALIDLVSQIQKSSPADERGHKLTMNAAYLKAVALVDSTPKPQAAVGVSDAARHYEAALRHIAETAFASKDWQYARDALASVPLSPATKPEAPAGITLKSMQHDLCGPVQHISP